MPNLAGKAYAINTISAQRWWSTPLLRFIFLLAPRLKPTRDLKKLSFIHFARWAILPRRKWPYLGPPQERERLEYDYLLFCSNFNGTWEQYIAAFSDVVSVGIDRIWSWTVNFPGARPLTPFLDFIRFNQCDTDHYYTAYPGASTTDVRAALQVQAEVDRLAADAPAMAPEEFARAYRAMLTRIQNRLGQTGPGPILE